MLVFSFGSFVGAQTLPIQRERIYSGPVNNGSDVGVAAAGGPDGHVVVAGNSAYASDRRNIYMAKYDAQTGAVIWSARSPGASAIPWRAWCSMPGAMSSSQAHAISVREARPAGSSMWGSIAARTAALIWQRIFDGGANERDYFNAVALDAQGNVVATGLSRRTSSSPIESDAALFISSRSTPFSTRRQSRGRAWRAQSAPRPSTSCRRD